MKKTIIQKIVCVTLTTLFLLNQLCYGLGIQPGSSQPEVRNGMYALGQKLFAAKRGPGAIDWDKYTPGTFTGEVPAVPDIAPTDVDYNNPYLKKSSFFQNIDMMRDPETGKINLIRAAYYWMQTEARIPEGALEIREGYFDLKDADGELGIARIERHKGNKLVLIIHSDFVKKWNHIAEHDKWFEITLNGEKRLVSVAWGLFFRLMKHEMTDLAKADPNFPKGALSHITAFENGIYVYGEGDDREAAELSANTIGGRFRYINDAIWMWFLGSYCYSNATRYDNDILKERLNWFFNPETEEDKKLKLNLEFPNLLVKDSARAEAISMTLLINHAFFGSARQAIKRDSELPLEGQRVGKLVNYIADYFVREGIDINDREVTDVLREIQEKLRDYIDKATAYAILHRGRAPLIRELDGITIESERLQVARMRINISQSLDDTLRYIAVDSVRDALNREESLLSKKIKDLPPVLAARLPGTGYYEKINYGESERINEDTLFSFYGCNIFWYLTLLEFRPRLAERMREQELEYEYGVRKNNIVGQPIYATGKGEEAPNVTIQNLKIISMILEHDVVSMIAKAGSGHPGGSLSMLKAVAALYFGTEADGKRIMRYDPSDPKWGNRDRFVLSKGHAAPGLYAALGRADFFAKRIAELKKQGKLQTEDVEGFLDTLRKLGSDLQGHTDMTKTAGVEFSGGPLGVGFSAAVGMAIAARMDDRDYTTYCMLGDGETQEGQVDEAGRHAGAVFRQKQDEAYKGAASMGLKMVAFLDWNGQQIDNAVTDVDVDYEGQVKLWEARGWNVVKADGDNIEDIIRAITDAKMSLANGKPAIIIMKTTKGAGLPGMAKHGAAPKEAEAKEAFKVIDSDLTQLTNGKYNPEKSREFTKVFVENLIKGISMSVEDKAKIDAANKIRVDARKEELRRVAASEEAQKIIGKLKEGYAAGKKVATRTANGDEVALIGADDIDMVAMSADLKDSVKFDKFAEAFGTLSAKNLLGRYIAPGIREAHMVALAAGLATCGKTVFIGTFSIFTARMLDQLNDILNTSLPIIIVGTHGGLATGPDGRTHQDAHSLGALGALPRVKLYEGADAEEERVLLRHIYDTAKAKGGIHYIRPARLDTPIIANKPKGWQEGAKKGFYTLFDSEAGKPAKDVKYDVAIISTGVITVDALEAAKELAGQGKRVKVINVTQIKALKDKENTKAFADMIRNADHIISSIDAVPEILEDRINFVLVHENIHPRSTTALGINEFGESGTPAELYARHGFDKAGIVKAALAALKSFRDLKGLRGRDWWLGMEPGRRELLKKFLSAEGTEPVITIPFDHDKPDRHYGHPELTATECMLLIAKNMEGYVNRYLIHPAYLLGRINNQTGEFTALGELAKKNPEEVRKNYGSVVLHPDLPRDKLYVIRWEGTSTPNGDPAKGEKMRIGQRPTNQGEETGLTLQEISEVPGVVGVKFMVYVDSSLPDSYNTIIAEVAKQSVAAHKAGLLFFPEDLPAKTVNGRDYLDAFESTTGADGKRVLTERGAYKKALWEAANPVFFASALKKSEVDYDAYKYTFPGEPSIMGEQEIRAFLRTMAFYTRGRFVMMLSGGKPETLVERARMSAGVLNYVGDFAGRGTWQRSFTAVPSNPTDTKSVKAQIAENLRTGNAKKQYDALAGVKLRQSWWEYLGLTRDEVQPAQTPAQEPAAQKRTEPRAKSLPADSVYAKLDISKKDVETDVVSKAGYRIIETRNNEFFILNPKGELVKTVKDDTTKDLAYDLSPDGRFILFYREGLTGGPFTNDDDSPQLYDLAKPEKPLFQSDKEFSSAQFAKGSKSLVLEFADEVITVNLENGAVSTVPKQRKQKQAQPGKKEVLTTVKSILETIRDSAQGEFVRRAAGELLAAITANPDKYSIATIAEGRQYEIMMGEANVGIAQLVKDEESGAWRFDHPASGGYLQKDGSVPASDRIVPVKGYEYTRGEWALVMRTLSSLLRKSLTAKQGPAFRRTAQPAFWSHDYMTDYRRNSYDFPWEIQELTERQAERHLAQLVNEGYIKLASDTSSPQSRIYQFTFKGISAAKTEGELWDAEIQRAEKVKPNVKNFMVALERLSKEGEGVALAAFRTISNKIRDTKSLTRILDEIEATQEGAILVGEPATWYLHVYEEIKKRHEDSIQIGADRTQPGPSTSLRPGKSQGEKRAGTIAYLKANLGNDLALLLEGVSEEVVLNIIADCREGIIEWDVMLETLRGIGVNAKAIAFIERALTSGTVPARDAAAADIPAAAPNQVTGPERVKVLHFFAELTNEPEKSVLSNHKERFVVTEEGRRRYFILDRKKNAGCYLIKRDGKWVLEPLSEQDHAAETEARAATIARLRANLQNLTSLIPHNVSEETVLDILADWKESKIKWEDAEAKLRELNLLQGSINYIKKILVTIGGTVPAAVRTQIRGAAVDSMPVVRGDAQTKMRILFNGIISAFQARPKCLVEQLSGINAKISYETASGEIKTLEVELKAEETRIGEELERREEPERRLVIKSVGKDGTETSIQFGKNVTLLHSVIKGERPDSLVGSVEIEMPLVNAGFDKEGEFCLVVDKSLERKYSASVNAAYGRLGASEQIHASTSPSLDYTAVTVISENDAKIRDLKLIFSQHPKDMQKPAQTRGVAENQTEAVKSLKRWPVLQSKGKDDVMDYLDEFLNKAFENVGRDAKFSLKKFPRTNRFELELTYKYPYPIDLPDEKYRILIRTHKIEVRVETRKNGRVKGIIVYLVDRNDRKLTRTEQYINVEKMPLPEIMDDIVLSMRELVRSNISDSEKGTRIKEGVLRTLNTYGTNKTAEEIRAETVEYIKANSRKLGSSLPNGVSEEAVRDVLADWHERITDNWRTIEKRLLNLGVPRPVIENLKQVFVTMGGTVPAAADQVYTKLGINEKDVEKDEVTKAGYRIIETRNNEFFILNPNGELIKTVKDDTTKDLAYDLSPDGRFILFYREGLTGGPFTNDDDSPQVYDLTRPEKPIFQSEKEFLKAQFAKDSKSLALEFADEVVTINLESGAEPASTSDEEVIEMLDKEGPAITESAIRAEDEMEALLAQGKKAYPEVIVKLRQAVSGLEAYFYMLSDESRGAEATIRILKASAILDALCEAVRTTPAGHQFLQSGSLHADVRSALARFGYEIMPLARKTSTRFKAHQAGTATIKKIKELRAMRNTYKEHPLIEVISVFATRIGVDIGPGSEKLTENQTQAIWEAVNAFHDDSTRIEILVPQIDIKLTDEINAALRDIKRREGQQIISCEQYTDKNLDTKLRNRAEGVKQIIITTKNSADIVKNLVVRNPDIFKERRVLNVELPANFAEMDHVEQTVHQARVLMIAVFARLLEKEGTLAIRAMLTEMLENHLPKGTNIGEFLDRLTDKEEENTPPERIRDRILWFIGRTVSLVERLGEELKFMKEFWRSA